MKREILFRGKSIEPSTEGKWIEGSLLVHGNCSYILPSNPITPFGIVKYRVDPETVGQVTGIMDKSGEDLFEGDIYNMGDDNIRYVIVWRNCMFIGRQLGNNSYAGLDYWESELKKVGNIHDNKDLLK